ncbi:tetratricopeptide repeat protein [Pedobacter sp. L105]|uniref:tetratricopeptide repeat protein n=1 Tax=Pedobacter sp. L105 TaxID=1641871 RepID=UPI00131C440E|nr:tetratricopeptide repeat protein [Pedobacter sp. L105]
MILNKFYLPFFGLALLTTISSKAQTISPDSTAAATRHLKELQAELLQSTKKGRVEANKVHKMLQLGLWADAARIIAANKKPKADYKLLKAEELILHNEFKSAEQLVNGVLKDQPSNQEAMLLKATLEIQAWRLPLAESICNNIIKIAPGNEAARLLLGRSLLLQKKYNEALKLAKEVESQNVNSAGAYLLEADVYFWNQHPELAEEPLKKSLTIDPYNADARFSYGYAIWRRIDATQMNAMAAQWEIALAVNPLHFQTNWHWGNGHTNLTYADYAEKDDDDVRKALEKADNLVRKNQVNDAIEVTRQVGRLYPHSVLPLMHRASIYYIAFDMNRTTRLDSAQALFIKILAIKKHYGPAHNGLSAVIKSRRIPYLAAFDSITNRLATTKITDMYNFTKVFPDVSYYPGSTVKAMVWNQLFTSVVYFPFLSKQGNTFRIPPLHLDLAIVMNSPSFRYMTTFDNRQWMDIRGVGSGAAAIEYVERGAFQERNVILHEYTHLFHTTVLTDAEKREIRAHYYKAMKEKRMLDYYSQNNEHEYFAQTYPAYFEPVKVHPLDFKSMNTTNDLKTKDPEMYAFIDRLVTKERAYLAGDQQAMASNWSEVYLNKSQSVAQKDIKLATSYLDTALVYDQKYLPVYLQEANLKLQVLNFEGAENWLKKAKAVDSTYAPIYATYAAMEAIRAQTTNIGIPSSVTLQADYLKKSIRLENDFQELAALNGTLRYAYRDNGQIAEAIKTADEYGKTGATVSTYLRDQRDDATAFAAVLRAELKDTASVTVLKHLVLQKPQHYEYRNYYADALEGEGKYKEAIATISEAQRILNASGNARSDYNLRIAALFQDLGQKDSVEFYLAPFLSGKTVVREGDKLRYVRLLTQVQKYDQAKVVLSTLKTSGDPYYLSDYFYTKAKLQEAQSLAVQSAESYRMAITQNPYHLKAYVGLLNYYTVAGKAKEAADLETAMKNFTHVTKQ